jgi:hypothetical protein
MTQREGEDSKPGLLWYTAESIGGEVIMRGAAKEGLHCYSYLVEAALNPRQNE